MTSVARILIIEDNKVNLELMSYLLNAFGYTTLSSTHGEEGLDIAARELPDLIICDVQMPVLDGYGVARRVKGDPALRGIPLVAVTASAMVGDRDKALAAGFDGYLPKPIDPATFVQDLVNFLPVLVRAPERAPMAGNTAAPPRPQASGRTILIVDDVAAHLELASSLFEFAGYNVVTTQDTADALKLARESAPDLIMSDVCMPSGSGYDFIASVKADASLRKIPFVFLTSTATSEQERARGLALGATRYLFRPLEPQALLSEIEWCLNNRSGN